MARKQKEPKMKAVRLDLSPEEHHALRKKAADANMSMARYAKLIVLRALKRDANHEE
jgi:hypothetical protein